MKLAKNQANAKQQPEAELLALENYSHTSSTLLTNNNMTDSKNKEMNMCGCIHEIIRLIIMKMKMKNRSPRYNIIKSKIILIIFWDLLMVEQIFL